MIMSLKNGMQLVFLTAFSCALFYRTTCLPAGPTYLSRSRTVDADADGDMNESPSVHNMEDFKLIYSITNIPRSARHADGLFTSGYSKLLGQLSAKDYLESLIAKRLSMDLAEEQLPVKRHSDAVFTDNYSRLRKEMAVKKYLNSVLSGKRSFENPSSIQNEASSQQTGDDISIDELVNLLPLGSPSS